MGPDRSPGHLRSVLVAGIALLLVTATLAWVPLAGAAATPAESEPNDSKSTAESISFGEQITGEIATDDDEDWYAIDVDRGESVNLSVTGQSGEVYVQLRDPNGRLSNSGPANDGQYVAAGETEHFGGVVASDTTLYVRVYSSTGSYSFEMNSVANDDREYDGNAGNATTVQFGQRVSGQLSINDGDWYAVDVDRGEAVNLSVTGQSGQVYVELRNAKGDLPSSGPGSNGQYVAAGETKHFGGVAASDTTFYVRVYYGRGSYAFEMNTVASGSEFDGNAGNATRIEQGEQVSGTLSINDGDWYAFEVDDDESIRAEVSLSSDSPDSLYVEFRNRTNVIRRPGNRVDTEKYIGPGETKTVGAVLDEAGTYYLRVYFGQGSYSFTVENVTNDPEEANEDQDGASPLFENPFTPVEGRLTYNDQDWLSFPASAGEEVSLTAAVTANATGNVFAELRNETNVMVGDSETTPLLDGGVSPDEPLSVSGTAVASGQHYLQVYYGEGTQEEYYTYDLRVDGERYGPPNDRFERPNPPVGNNDRSNATDLDAGFYRNLGMVDDDEDWFAVDLDAGERVVADVAFDHDANDLALELADDGTTLRKSDSATDGERVSFTAPSDGTYYLTVSGEAGANATYALDVNVIRQVDVTVGPGSDALAPGNTTTYAVNVTSVSAGLSSANLTFEATNTSVVTIQSVQAAGTGSVEATVAADNGSATANVTGLDPAAGGVVTVARVTVDTVENGSATLTGSAAVSTANGFAYPVRNVQNTTVTVEPAGSRQHESGVSQRLFDAVAGSDGDLDRTDVIAAVSAYVRTQSVDGVPITRADVLALVQYYVVG